MIKNILNNTPTQVQRRVASAVAKEVAVESQTSVIKLPTGGKPLTLTVGAVGAPKETIQISHEQVDFAQAEFNLLIEQTIGGTCFSDGIKNISCASFPFCKHNHKLLAAVSARRENHSFKKTRCGLTGGRMDGHKLS